MKDCLLNTDEASDLLGIKPWTLRAWVSQRRIPYVKIGRCVRFNRQALEEYVQQNTIEPVTAK
ncbi:helix-turn-helix domain-containing protein [bacterium]|nr:helix-turn-helix domain-containing protein [bacterium]